MLARVVDETVQVFGGYGFTNDYPAERYYRDARIARIYEGTNEINRLVIANTILKRARQSRLALSTAVQETATAALEGKLKVPAFEGPLADMQARVWQAKRLFHIATRVFLQGMGEKVTDQAALADQQECLGWLADCVMETYALESTMLRTQTGIDANGEATASLPIALMQYHAERSSRNLAACSENIIHAMADADAMPQWLNVAASLNPCRPTNLRDLGRLIARAVIEKDGELAA
jgi:butyryl-CoA dehydrogenase